MGHLCHTPSPQDSENLKEEKTKRLWRTRAKQCPLDVTACMYSGTQSSCGYLYMMGPVSILVMEGKGAHMATPFSAELTTVSGCWTRERKW